MRGLSRRAAGAIVLGTFLLGAFANLLANGLPLLVAGAEGISSPAWRGAAPADFVWNGLGLGLLLWLLWPRGRLRGVLLGAALLSGALLGGFHEPDLVDPEPFREAEAAGEVWLLSAPLPHGPREVSGPAAEEAFSSWAHPLGTDAVGHDVLALFLHGLRVSFTFGFGATLISAALGIAIGAVAGWRRGLLDVVASFLIQVTMAFPVLLFLLATWRELGGSLLLLVLVLGLLRWTGFARMARAECGRLATAPFVVAARAQGFHGARLLLRTLPHALPPLLVQASFAVAQAIQLEGALSFLGVGVPPEVPSLGRLFRALHEVTGGSVRALLVPGALLTLLLLALQSLGRRGLPEERS